MQDTTAPPQLTTTPPAGLTALRVPFPAEQIGHLPKIWCQNCSRSAGKVCNSHHKARCNNCNNNITNAHLDLDYVGHAELTNRLLDVDLTWTWEPLSFDANGLPAFDQFGGLWIRLTVCGQTRIGYGDSGGKDGANAVKEAIGDALRNAAMRFGAALDLWAKSDLRVQAAEQAAPQQERPKPTPPPQRPQTQQQPRQNRPPQPRRDYVAEARAAHAFQQVRAIYKDAADAGAPPELLTIILDLGNQLAAAEATGRDEQTEPVPQRKNSPPTDQAAQYRAAWFKAERTMREAAKRAQLANVDEEFRRNFGVIIGDATPEQLAQMTSILTGSSAA